MGIASGVVLWIAAWVCLVAALFSPMPNFDRPGSSSGPTASQVAFVLAHLLFLGSGPVAYVIGRKVILLALPAVLFAAWALGVFVAYAT